MPNETLKRFHPQIKKDDNLHDQWNWKTHPFSHLGHLDRVFEFNHCQFCPFDFNILFHLNCSK
jgi:hypothetical protein